MKMAIDINVAQIEDVTLSRFFIAKKPLLNSVTVEVDIAAQRSARNAPFE